MNDDYDEDEDEHEEFALQNLARVAYDSEEDDEEDLIFRKG